MATLPIHAMGEVPFSYFPDQFPSRTPFSSLAFTYGHTHAEETDSGTRPNEV